MYNTDDRCVRVSHFMKELIDNRDYHETYTSCSLTEDEIRKIIIGN